MLRLRPTDPRRPVLIYLGLLIFAVLLLIIGNAGPVRELRNGIRFAFGPLQEVLAGGSRAVGSIFSAFTEIDQLRLENQALVERVGTLEQQLAQLEVLREENARLSEIVGTKKALDHDTIAATVIQRSPSEFERLITIDRGAEAGVEVNDAVLAPGGSLVGVVTEVFRGGASVRLLSDTRSLVIGLDVESRATGEVLGDLSQPLKFEKVAATETIAVGDTVTTAGQLVSGVRAILPRGLLIGTIVDVVEGASGFTKSGRILPAADLERLEAVLVITSYAGPRVPEPGETLPPDEPDPDATDEAPLFPDRSPAPGATTAPR